jgi:DNA-binding NtrC family response regulator
MPGTEVIDLLVHYDWPGNVRELKNVIERAMLLDAQDALLVAHLPTEIRGGAPIDIPATAPRAMAASVTSQFFPMTLRDVERIQIEKTLEETHGNKSRAAAILGISRQTLREKLKTFHGVDEQPAAEA